MLIKFESKSNRVKGVSFHPKRPWVLSALHNGTIQLWDYRMGTLIDKFEEHDGPVRGVAFHSSQPLFVSGGDDYKIKVWNYKQRRCLFTLTGHLDYIRTVFFHHEYPWIISASDDQTIRIWNWQSRQCISILTGHNHYVMCAQFHPKEDLVVSASLDQTVRVWDISGLRKKNSAPSSTFSEDLSRNPANHADIFGNTDVLVKYVLEGHERGVNWACFHPTMPLIVSGADDRQVKLWRMSDTKAWEVDTCRGHYNNVSCALFHPRQELIVSNSEDKSIRVWDMSKRSGVQTFRRESERFWVLAAHPELNLFAAGHDCGLIVFKLERERPAYAIHQNSLFYVKDKTIRLHDLQSGSDAPLLGIRKTPGLNTQPRSLSYNPAENAILLITGVEGGSYELYQLPKQASSSIADVRDASSDCRSGLANAAIFVARNRYVTLNKSQQLLTVHTVGSDAVRTINLNGTVSEVFYSGTGQVLLSTINSVVMYDLQQQSSVAELQGAPVKYAYWNADMSMVALISKHTITIASKKLEQLCLIHETIRIKSGVWDESGVFVYSTLNHIKYALPQGDNGIIRTLEQPLYVVRAAGKTLHCLDRDAKVRILTIEPAEYRFKLALVRRQYDEVLHMIRNSNLVGQSIIAYLRNKGFPEVALHFVRDAQTRFDLALECGNLTAAMESAKTLESPACWSRLASSSLRQGNQQTVETAYQRVKNFERLSFLYLITGQSEKLRKMIKIAELRNDTLSHFQNSVFVGDIEEQIRIYRAVGQDVLAYWMAKNYGLHELSEEILEAAGKNAKDVEPLNREATLLVPPISTIPTAESAENWPQLAISRGIFETAGFVLPQEKEKELSNKPLITAVKATEQVEVIGDWGDGDLDENLLDARSKDMQDNDQAQKGENEEGGWDIDDLDLATVAGVVDVPQLSAKHTSKFELPPPGASPSETWIKNSTMAADHIAAGSFESAMQALNRQYGIVNFVPLREYFISVQMAAKVSQSVLGAGLSLSTPLIRNWEVENEGTKPMPLTPFRFQTLVDLLQTAYQETTAGRFSAAMNLFTQIIQISIFTVTTKRGDMEELRQLVTIAREYILGLMIETARKEISTSDPASLKRNVELAVYFTHCDLQPAHALLSLQVAMVQAYKTKCFSTAAIMIRRLLELGPPPQLAQKARQIQAVVEKAPTDEMQLAYEPLNPFSICAATFTPIYKGKPICNCGFCGASFLPEYEGKLCRLCQLAEISHKPKPNK